MPPREPSDQAPDALTEQYRALLTGGEPDEIRRRRLYGRLPSNPRCVICFAPFKGPGSVLMRWLGRRPFPKNPHICEACFTTSPPGGCEIDVGALFVDVRGSTGLSTQLGATAFARVMNRYYEVASAAMVDSEAFVEITGDELFGLYLPAYTRGNYARVAIETAERILRTVADLPLGAGVEIGRAWVGTVGDPDRVRDFRAIGDPINAGAALVAEAGVGECLISQATYDFAEMQWANLEAREVRVKGRDVAQSVRVMKIASHPPGTDKPSI
jgi:adenylate cyclase